MGLVLLLAGVLRFVDLGINPPALNQDEAVNGYDAFVLGRTLRDHHGNFMPVMLQSFDDWASPVLTYATIPFVKIFGLSIFSIRMVTALLGVFSIWLFYILLKHFFKKRDWAIIGAFLLAISPWHITLSRWAIPPSVISFFLFLFLDIFLWTEDKFKQDNKIWRYVIPGILAGVLTATYPTQKLFVPLFIFVLGIIYLRKKMKCLLVFWLSFGITVLPIYILTLINPIYNSRFGTVSIFSGQNVLRNIISRYGEYYLPDFHFGMGDVDVMHQIPGLGNSYEFLMPFFYLGMVICTLGVFKKIVIKDADKKVCQLLLVWLLLFPLAASFTQAHNMLLRVIHGLPLVIIFFVFCGNYFERFIKNDLKIILITVIVLLGIFNVFKFSKTYFAWYPKLAFKEFQYGVKESFDYLKKNEDKFKTVVIDENINQGYIYYLFFSKFDPKNLNYTNPSKSSNKYVIGPIPDLKTAPIETIKFGEEKMFGIYNEDEANWYVKKLYKIK